MILNRHITTIKGMLMKELSVPTQWTNTSASITQYSWHTHKGLSVPSQWTNTSANISMVEQQPNHYWRSYIQTSNSSSFEWKIKQPQEDYPQAKLMDTLNSSQQDERALINSSASAQTMVPFSRMHGQPSQVPQLNIHLNPSATGMSLDYFV